MTQQSLELQLPAVEPILFPVGKRIAFGFRFLDMMDPGWRDRIDRERLDISSPVHCCFGQLYRHYLNGCSQYYLEPLTEAAQMGFSVLDPESPDVQREYEALTRGWKFAIDHPHLRMKRLKIAA